MEKVCQELAHKSISKDGKRKVGQDTEGSITPRSVVKRFCILLMSPSFRKYSSEILLTCFKLDWGIRQ